MPLSVGVNYIIYSITCPTNHSDVGFLFNYPIYANFTYQVFYVLGSWQWTYWILWTLESTSNKKFNDKVYDLIVGATLWAYVCHYLIIVLVSNYIVRKHNFSFVWAVILNVVITEIVIHLAYILLCRL